MIFWLLLSCLLLGLSAACTQAAIRCDGVDDQLRTGVPLSTFLTAATGTMTLWYRPTGFPGSWSTECHGGSDLVVSDENNRFLGLFRHPDLEGTGQRLCAGNWDGGWGVVATTYSVDVWTHLAWVHGGGSLCFYKDGAQMGCTVSLDTTQLDKQVVLCGGGGGGIWAVGEGEFAAVQLHAAALSSAELAVLAGSRLLYGGWSQPSGAWTLDTCVTSGSADGVAFPDWSGHGAFLTANNGADDAGMGCLGTAQISPGWGVE